MEHILLNNRYLIKDRIGVGGMAYVYRAEDQLLKRDVAVKILKQQFVEDDEFVDKFKNEALSAASLSHSNIVNIFDVGQQEVDGQTLHFIVMELVEGITLKAYIQEEGKLSDEEVVRISKQIAYALSEAHNHNIVHRDIKPANILLNQDKDVKVTDFGIARISTTATITYTNSILGTVHYISPEQAKGRFIDQKSDIYSLGVVMYEMATGEVPFDAENSVGIAIKHIQEDPVPPIELNPNLHPGLNDIILKCLEKEPIDRYFDVQELIADLNDYKSYSDTVYIPTPVAADVTGDTAKVNRDELVQEANYVSTPVYEDEEEEASGEKAKWAVLITALVIALITLMVFFFGRRNDQRLEETTATVPPLVNISENQALDLLEERGLRGDVVEYRNDETIAEGYVIEQSIENGTTVDRGTVVQLVVSDGKEKVSIPDVRNMEEGEAKQALEEAGFLVARTNYENSDNVEAGYAIGTDPEIGNEIERGSDITLIVSKGRISKMTSVPVLTNQNQSSAIEAIRAANLTLGNINTENSQYDPGVVIGQSIEPGKEVEQYSTIDITVSLGPAQSSEQSSESSSEVSEEPVDQVEYLHNIQVPTGKDSFQLTIYDLNISSESPIYNETLSSSQADEYGQITVSTIGSSDANFYYEIDGRPAESWMEGETPKESESVEEVPEESSTPQEASGEE